MNDPIRLERLLDIAQRALIDDVCSVILSMCIDRGVRVYFRVPPGHVVANHDMAVIDRRTRDTGARPVVMYLGPARVEHQIRWIEIDLVGLKQILDAGSVVLAQHFNGGLIDCHDGLSFHGVECCVIRKDSPEFHHSDAVPKPRLLTEGVVFPVMHEVRFNELFVSRSDGVGLIKAAKLIGIADKWGHKELAPHVYRMYSISQESLDESEIASRLIEGDETGVFTKAIANTAARILKVEVRPIAEQNINVALIRDNETRKDYSDPTLSKRMSLLLLATDYWLHDQSLRKEPDRQLKQRRTTVESARDKKAGKAVLKTMEMELLDAELAARRVLSFRLYMPSGLREFLKEVGFSSNQALQLERIIKGKKIGGVHARTRRAAGSTTKVKSAKPDQI